MIFKDKLEDMDVSVWANVEASFSLPIVLIVSPSTIDKMLEIFGPIFEQNASINFEPIFEKSVNFEHFVNGRWTHY